MRCLHILELNPLMAALFANILSHSVGCLFILFMVPLPVQNLLRLIRYQFFMEKEMATHFSTLAWKIPWMEEPGRLQSMGSQRVRHD